MKLTRRQQKFVRRHRDTLSVAEIAMRLNVPHKQVKLFVRSLEDESQHRASDSCLNDVTEDAAVAITVRKLVVVCLAIFAVAAVVYSPTISYDFVNWDDPVLVQKNPWIRDVWWGIPIIPRLLQEDKSHNQRSSEIL